MIETLQLINVMLTPFRRNQRREIRSTTRHQPQYAVVEMDVYDSIPQLRIEIYNGRRSP